MSNDLQIPDHLLDLLKNSQRIVFFGGAGTSTESGIPDFRSARGIYSTIPEDALCSRNLYERPKVFFTYYRKLRIYPDIQPHEGHRILQRWESEKRLSGIITQNIDGLHQKAGSIKVIELHGSTQRNYCESCGKTYSLEAFLSMDLVPCCTCGGKVRPDVTLFGEMLNQKSVNEAIELIRTAEIVIIGGTSLVVYPAAGLIDYFQGKALIMINLGSTPYDTKVNLMLNMSFMKAMIALDKLIQA